MTARAPGPNPDDLPCYTRGQLREAVSDLIRECLDMFVEDVTRPALLRQRDLAAALQVSERTIFDFRREGMPVILIGESPRYELAPCLEWLRARTAKGGAS